MARRQHAPRARHFVHVDSASLTSEASPVAAPRCRAARFAGAAGLTASHHLEASHPDHLEASDFCRLARVQPHLVSPVVR
jgi:hypothetical protein